MRTKTWNYKERKKKDEHYLKIRVEEDPTQRKVEIIEG